MAKFFISGNALQTLGAWVSLLRGLTIDENVEGYEWEGTILATQTVTISHNLKRIPKRFIITDASGTRDLLRGADRWDDQVAYIENNDASDDFVGKILFLP